MKKGLYIGPRGGKWADSKHTIPWVDENRQKRLRATQFYNDLINYVKNNSKSFRYGEDGSLTIAADKVSDIFKGKNLKIMFTAKGSSGIGVHKKTGETFILVNALKNPFDAKHLDTRISKDVIIHELTHFQDKGYNKGKPVSIATPSVYANHPSEFNAYVEEGIARIERMLEIAKEKEKEDAVTAEKVKAHFFGSGTFSEFKDRVSEKFWPKEFIENLNKKNIRKFNKRLYQLWGDSKELTKAEMYIGPRGGKWRDPQHTIPWDEEAEDRKGVESKKEVKRGKPGSQLNPEVLQKLQDLKIDKYPQADIPIEDIQVNISTSNINNRAVIVWRDTKGRIQAGYTPQFHEVNAKNKWERVVKYKDKVDGILKNIDKQLVKEKPGTVKHQGLVIARIIGETGLRPGSLSSAKENHFGISTLKPEHIYTRGWEVGRGKTYDKGVTLKFVGKQGKENKTIIKDAGLIRQLKYYKDHPSNTGFLFEPNALEIARGVLPKGMKLKDFRTIKAGNIAFQALRSIPKPPPLTKDLKKDKILIAKALLFASEQVADRLNNTPTVARGSYIHPEIFEQWLREIKAPKELKAV